MAIKNLLLGTGIGALTAGSTVGNVASTLIFSEVATSISGVATVKSGQEEIIEEGKYGKGTVLTTVGTSVTVAGTTACSKICDYYEAHAYVETLDDEQVETALNNLGVSIDETQEPKTLTKHI